MAKHIVTCRECKQKFDAQPEGKDALWVMPSKNWYYHKECYETWVKNRKQNNDVSIQKDNEEYLKDITYYLSHVLKYPFDWARVTKDLQILTGPKYKRTAKGLRFALIYWYEIKKNGFNPEYPGIWCAQLCYEESRVYWQERMLKQNDILSQYDKQIRDLREREHISIKKKTSKKWKSKINEIGVINNE